MALSGSKDFLAHVALCRFGLGPKPGDLKRVASDPRGAVEAEIRAEAALLKDPYLVSTAETMRNFYMRRAVGRLNKGRKVKGPAATALDILIEQGKLPPDVVKTADVRRNRADKRDDDDADDASDDKMAKNQTGRRRADYPKFPGSPFAEEVEARFVHARKCDPGFAERWVMFWTNHFTVSSQTKNFMRWLVGGYEREAIRPHVFGDFETLLMAATRHSAMLRYLNNGSSTGPNSENGKRQSRGLNENHARELLELHTVGVSGGYAQADIIEFAKVLTGWRSNSNMRAEDYLTFRYQSAAHEPGDRTVMGALYQDDGVRQGERVLRDLARKPQTAAHIARRLAIYFVADDPTQALVERLAKTFRETDGDLRRLALTLVGSDEAWEAPRAKMRSPQEFVFAAARLTETPPDAEMLGATLDTLGQPLWGPPSPKGYSLVGRDWIAPDAQTNRLDFTVNLAAREGGKAEPLALAEDVLGAEMSDETRTAVKRAGSREQAFALFLMSPEMQRR